MFKWILLIALVDCAIGQDRPIVTLPTGQVQGIRMTGSQIGMPSFLAFLGVPYAEPPIGALRWRNPQPKRAWPGVWDAGQHGPTCTESEDCLHLNVATSQLAGSRPVMVWIHGGSFTGGSGNYDLYGPNLILNEGNTVVVNINYRLGALGFLSTGDQHAQGNWGAKDMLLALRWVQTNIHLFGGNRNQVTVFGESAGSVAVHYLMLNQIGQGLFHRAILQSGVTINPWSFQPNPLREAQMFAQRIGITWSSNLDLVNQLRNVPIQTLLDNQGGWLDLPVPRGYTPFEFVPNIEPENSPEERFLTMHPVSLMNRGQIMQIPFIIGYTSVESLFMVREVLLDNTVHGQFAANPHFYASPTFNLVPGVHNAEINEVAMYMRNYYFEGDHPSQTYAYNYSLFMSDHHFSYGVDRTIRYHARRQSQPIYYYKFSFSGSLNMVKILLLLNNFPGAMHGDDVPYLFDIMLPPVPLVPTQAASLTRSRMVRMWSNFAVFGDPTPVTDGLIPTRWNRYSLANEEMLDIDDNLWMRNAAFFGRLQKWHDFQDRFNPTYPG